MGELSEIRGPRRQLLEADTFVGRGPHCGLRLEPAYVSGQHASLRWSEGRWELRDLASRNGTWLNGQRVRKREFLREGDEIAFGHVEEAWRLCDAAAPDVMLINMSTQAQRVADGATVGLPSDDAPLLTLMRRIDGCWQAESEDQPIEVVENGAILQVGDDAWRFSCPSSIVSTVTAQHASLVRPPRIHFSVSRDEEYVQVLLEWDDRSVDLGSRSQFHLLLTLARARLQDIDHGLPPTSCGWVYKEDLVSGAQTPQRVDNEVFRIRKHFGQYAEYAAAAVIERRPRTRQLRIGFDAIEVTVL